NLDLLYRERGFELYWEYSRRSDMIRFGHYEDSYTSKTNADVRKRLFPIPQSAIDGASSVPGYLVQNEGHYFYYFFILSKKTVSRNSADCFDFFVSIRICHQPYP
ncbi:MAG: RagB/SusD family nutrient uptake outer membrane protein, partial [Chryseobacterium sp.]